MEKAFRSPFHELKACPELVATLLKSHATVLSRGSFVEHALRSQVDR